MLSALLCLGMLWATWSKGRQLEGLRSKQKELLAQVSDDSGTAPPAGSDARLRGRGCERGGDERREHRDEAGASFHGI